MRVVRELDAGPMLATVRVPIGPLDTTGQLEPVLATAGASLRQGDKELIRVLAACGSATEELPVLVDGAPPELPPYEECPAEDSSSDPDAPPAMA